MADQTTIKKEFIKTVSRTVSEFKLLAQKDSVLAAVSGGPDSVALLLSLLALREKYSLKIGIAHLNHELRGEESLRDESFTKTLADKLKVEFHGGRVNVRAYARANGLSIEEGGREVRYNFFKQIAKHHGYLKIATGHTKDDNAELILMNLLRGSGPKGLSGIPPLRDNLFIRPLIRVAKARIFQFLEIEKQSFMIDSSNKDTAYLRNKIRNQLIPHLKSEYNPEIIDALDRLGNILRLEEEYLEAETENLFGRCLIKTDNSSVSLSRELLSTLHQAPLNRVLRKAVKMVKKDLKRFSLAHINDIVEFCFFSSSGVSLDLPGQIRVYKDKDTIRIKKEDTPLRQIGTKQKQSRRMGQKKQEKES